MTPSVPFAERWKIIMKLKAYLRLSYNLKFLPIKKYEIWSAKAVELGRMVGGWIKSSKKD